MSSTKADWESTSQRVRGVLGSHKVVSGAGGVGVRGFTLSLDNTASGANGTSIAPLKLARMFSPLKTRECAALKAVRNSVLEI